MASRKRKAFVLAANESSTSSNDDDNMLDDRPNKALKKELQSLIATSDDKIIAKLSLGVLPKASPSRPKRLR